MFRLIVLDIDGVITDGYERLGLARDSGEFKQICYQDLDAIQEAKSLGLEFTLLTAEDDELVRRLAARVRIDAIFSGFKDKRQGLEKILSSCDHGAEAICFVGDSNRDAKAFPLCGLSFAPANGSQQARSAATFALHREGGKGAVAEAIEIVLKLNRMHK